jgi:predicted transcriptional regulator
MAAAVPAVVVAAVAVAEPRVVKQPCERALVAVAMDEARENVPLEAAGVEVAMAAGRRQWELEVARMLKASGWVAPR